MNLMAIKLRDYEREHLLGILEVMDENDEEFCIARGALGKDLDYMTQLLIRRIIWEKCQEEVDE